MKLSPLLFGFSGRIPRMTYWITILCIAVASFVGAFGIGMIAAMLGGGGPPAADAGSAPSLPPVAEILLLAFCLFLIWISLAVHVKRWHDRGKSAWWVLIGLIPLVGPIWCLIELGCLPGTAGPNEYGADPLA